MTEKKVPENVFELVYTAANKLLAGGDGYGIVASTKSIPNGFEKPLGVLWSYTFLQALKDNLLGKVGERFVFMPIKHGEINYLTFSRVSDTTGTPYLSRTTIIAHHLATPAKELESVEMNAADMVAWAGGLSGYEPKFEFIKKWDTDPESLEPIKVCRNATLSAETLLKEMGIENNLLSLLKDALAGVANRLFDLEETKKIAILIIPCDWQTHVPRLLAIILYLLPNGIQNSLVAVSQVWDKADLNFYAGLVFTYPKAPYLETMKQSHMKNKVELFDLINLKPCTSTVLPEVSVKNYKQYALGFWNTKNPKNPKFLQIVFNRLDSGCQRKNDVLALKRSIDEFLAKESAENHTISEKLEDVINKLKIFCNDSAVHGNVVFYLTEFVNYAVKQVVENKERCDALLEIWKHAEIIVLKPDEITKVLESNYKAIADHYEDILKYTSSTSSFAKACINVNRNLEIVKIVGSRKVPLDSLLAAIEIEVLNSRGVVENTTKKNETSNIEKDLVDVASNWFILGPRIIKPAWCRIMKGGREKDNPCYFSKAIVNLQLDRYLAAVKIVESNL